MRLSAGAQIGHYTLDYRLGAGGMAEVWAATNGILGVKVALKVLFGGNPILQQRLLREGRAQAALDHPNILPVRDVIDVGGSLGLILPLIQGPSLDKLLQKYWPTTNEAVALFRAIVEGVGHAHERGLIHRDLKPGNVLLEERRGRIIPRVADFGLVKSSEEPGQTRTHAVMGTLNYAAPEQLLDASKVDHRADLFSLGVILVELLTGKRPFQGSSLRELLSAYETGPNITGIPEAFEPLCLDLLAHDPHHRPSDCAAVLDGLKEVHPPSLMPVLGLASGLAKAMRSNDFGAAAEMAIETMASKDTAASVTFADSLFDSASLPSDKTPPPRNNLPAEVDAFIGREKALQTLGERLEESRLVSILGTGGAGKTRFSLQYARRHLHEYPGGVFFCDLSEAKTVEGIVFVVSQAMDVPLGKGDHLKQLGHAIAGHGNCLLIFDNFEQIVEHASVTVGAWLKRAGLARFMVTSRVLLEIDGERTMRLSPLDEAEAVELFTERARAKKSSFTMTKQNRHTIEQLVRLLDGLPLAIELATARIKVMGPEKILKRMNQRFKLLATGKRNTAQRQATLRAAIDWSWELLEDWEQSAFAQCAVFEGGFTLEAAEAVIDLDDFGGAGHLDAPWAMDAVQSLVDKSLLVVLAENRLGEVRFGMLMSIHDYAKEKLGVMNEAVVASIRRRHAGVYTQFGEEEELKSLEGFEGVIRWWALRAEVDNLLAAHRFAIREEDVDAAISLALALDAIAERQQPSIALKPLNQTLHLNNIQATPRRAKVHIRLGWVQSSRGEIAEAQAHYHNAMAILREDGERRSEGRVLGYLGLLHNKQGEMAEAQAHYERALAIAREVGDRDLEGHALGNLGNLHSERGRMVEAQTHYDQTLTIYREAGDRRGEGITLIGLGNLYWSQGALSEAQARYSLALVAFREAGDRSGEGTVLGNLGILLAMQGQVVEAQTHYTQALSIHRDVGDRRSEGTVLIGLGNLYAAHGQVEQAQTHYTQALAIHRDVGDRRGEGMVLGYLGLLHHDLGEMAEAQVLYTQALAITREVGNRRHEGGLLGELGLLKVLGGAPEIGLSLLKQGEALLREVNHRLRLVLLLCNRAHAEHLANNPGAACAALNEARQIADDLNVTADSELARKIATVQAILDEDPTSSNA